MLGSSDGSRTTGPAVRRLQHGDRADQPTFATWYGEADEDIRAELIDGEVFVNTPAMFDHAQPHSSATVWLGVYASKTPGVLVGSEPSTVLSERDEVQPDAVLLIDSAFDGATRLGIDRKIEGPPELVVEVSNTSSAIDLNRKKLVYERAGVREYLVVLVREHRIRWFSSSPDGFVEIEPSNDGLYRSSVFPGLWLDGSALLRNDLARMLAALNAGLASSEHAEFVKLMESRRPKPGE